MSQWNSPTQERAAAMTRAIAVLPFRCTYCDQRTCSSMSLFPANDLRRLAAALQLHWIAGRCAHCQLEPCVDESLEWHQQVSAPNVEQSAVRLSSIAQATIETEMLFDMFIGHRCVIGDLKDTPPGKANLNPAEIG